MRGVSHATIILSRQQHLVLRATQANLATKGTTAIVQRIERIDLDQFSSSAHVYLALT